MKFVRSFFSETGTASMTRLCAFLACVAGCVVAIQSPDAWQTVTACLGGGSVALLTRRDADES